MINAWFLSIISLLLQFLSFHVQLFYYCFSRLSSRQPWSTGLGYYWYCFILILILSLSFSHALLRMTELTSPHVRFRRDCRQRRSDRQPQRRTTYWYIILWLFHIITEHAHLLLYFRYFHRLYFTSAMSFSSFPFRNFSPPQGLYTSLYISINFPLQARALKWFTSLLIYRVLHFAVLVKAHKRSPPC